MGVAMSRNINKVMMGLFAVLLFGMAGCGGGGGSTSNAIVDDGHAAPVANAGSAKSVVTKRVVTLDGSKSRDAEGLSTTLKYSWAFTARPAGSSAALVSATAAKPTFTADLDGEYTVRLTVDDGRGKTGVATVVITAAPNKPPVAYAGFPRSVLVGATVQLDATASSDPDGDVLTKYEWLLAKPAGSGAVLSSTTAAKPTFIADVVGDYSVSLTVYDVESLASAKITVKITVVPVGSVLPVARVASSPKEVITNNAVYLNGSSSSYDGASLSNYLWSVTKPDGSLAVLIGGITLDKPYFTPDQIGDYSVNLVVTAVNTLGDTVNSVPANVTITAIAPYVELGREAAIGYNGDVIVGLPYIPASEKTVTADTFTLFAKGADFTLSDIYATDGSTSFSGFIFYPPGTTILTKNSTVTFTLVSHSVSSNTLTYHFKVDGKDFTYTVK